MLKGKPYLTTGALFMSLIVVLGAIGVVNGLWSKNLIIEGTVTTGDLNADWDCGYTNDDGLDGLEGVVQGGGCAIEGQFAVIEPDGDDGRDPYGSFDFPYSDPFIQKDVADCILSIGDENGDPPEGFGDQVAYIDITNAYPSYECTITLFLTNTGSIPFNIIGSELVIDAEDPIEYDGCAFEVVQVDPGEEEQLECTVHILQTAEQNVCSGVTSVGTDGEDDWVVVTEDCTDLTIGDYSFAIQVCVAQWNEEATFEQCKSSEQHEGPPDLSTPEPEPTPE
jgi:hypothetical protein